MKRSNKLSATTLLLATSLSQTVIASDPQEVLYTLMNSSAGNQVLLLQRMDHDILKLAGQFSTGGLGTDAGLGNQGALALSANARYLFAVNAASNDISVFRIYSDHLELSDRVAEQGITPVSIAVNSNKVYVVNSGDDSIFGFSFDSLLGKLSPLAHSHRQLSSTGSGAAQISFNQDGNALVITEKASNKITTFMLNKNGIPTKRHSIKSSGTTPFGFAFGKRDQFFVSNAAGAQPNLGTVSSYTLNTNGNISRLTKETLSGQTAACWLITTADGAWAFTADTPANAISSFSIDYSGQITLKESIAASEMKPTDLAISPNSMSLYSLNNGDHSLAVYSISSDGTLTKKAMVDNLPSNLTGLIAR